MSISISIVIGIQSSSYARFRVPVDLLQPADSIAVQPFRMVWFDARVYYHHVHSCAIQYIVIGSTWIGCAGSKNISQRGVPQQAPILLLSRRCVCLVEISILHRHFAYHPLAGVDHGLYPGVIAQGCHFLVAEGVDGVPVVVGLEGHNVHCPVWYILHRGGVGGQLAVYFLPVHSFFNCDYVFFYCHIAL